MSQYRKKPVVIEAKQYQGTNGDEIWQWSEGKGRHVDLVLCVRIEEPQQFEELPGNASLEWVIPFGENRTLYASKDGAELVVYDEAGQPLDAVERIAGVYT